MNNFISSVVSYEEALKHEKKAVHNSGDIETTDCEKEKRSRASRKTKLPYDPTSIPAIEKPTRRRRVLSSGTSDEELTPLPPTPPGKGKTLQKPTGI